jgi:hypothetical protein
MILPSCASICISDRNGFIYSSRPEENIGNYGKMNCATVERLELKVMCFKMVCYGNEIAFFVFSVFRIHMNGTMKLLFILIL